MHCIGINKLHPAACNLTRVSVLHLKTQATCMLLPTYAHPLLVVTCIVNLGFCCSSWRRQVRHTHIHKTYRCVQASIKSSVHVFYKKQYPNSLEWTPKKRWHTSLNKGLMFRANSVFVRATPSSSNVCGKVVSTSPTVWEKILYRGSKINSTKLLGASTKGDFRENVLL